MTSEKCTLCVHVKSGTTSREELLYSGATAKGLKDRDKELLQAALNLNHFGLYSSLAQDFFFLFQFECSGACTTNSTLSPQKYLSLTISQYTL